MPAALLPAVPANPRSRLVGEAKMEIGGFAMHSVVRRQAFVVTSIVSSLLSYSALMAEPVRLEQAQKVTERFLKTRVVRPPKLFSVTAQEMTAAAGLTLSGFRQICDDDGTVLAYIGELAPNGFIATSSDTDIAPVIAYSFRNSFPADGDEENPLYRLLKEDMKLRAAASAEYGPFKTMENNDLWNFYADEETEDANDSVSQTFQQWPQENTTSTGGWLETTWEQGPPYNDFCPLDTADGLRSYVGCVATALAQLVNYHQQCRVQFEEDDSYMTYGGVEIDADCNLYDFPSFEELNEYLAALRLKYSRQADLNDTDVAALSFACGIATLVDYSSEGSGASPYDLHSALPDPFGFYSADMTGGLSCESYHVLQENIVNGLPALLGIGPPDGYGGHVVVCDGYNTNGEYHLNFGWGSSRPADITEAWYRLPTDIPTRDDIILETILNIRPVPPSITVEPAPSIFYSAPGQESEPRTLFIENNTEGPMSISSISSPEGFVVAGSNDVYSDHIDAFEIPGPGQEASINVKFCPDQAGGYYGTLTIGYGEGNAKHVILKGCSFTGGTEIQGGEVSGTWSEAGSPYFIHGDVNVPANEVLVVEPGVKVIFVGRYGMTVGENAKLVAEGNANSPIEFTAWNRDMGWTGLRFLGSGDDDTLSYCSITFSKKHAGYDYLYGSNDEDSSGGAVYCYGSSPTITNCKITNNIGDKGGAIYCIESYPTISNTVIANNASMGGRPQCGGICADKWTVPGIRNCTIVNNSPGGIFTTSWDGMDVTNTIVWGNDKYQIQTEESTPTVSFCDVQGGYDGQGNIDADPCFFAPSSGVGPDYDGSSAHWTLKSCSPCINSGSQIELPQTDLAGSPRIYSDIVDIGAYENQSDLPLMTMTPAGTVDTGFVHVDTNSVTGLELTNTGKIDFNVESLSISDANNVFSIVTPVADHLLAPGDSVQVEIGFAPVEEKVYTGTLQVRSTSSNAPNQSVILRGLGVSGTIISGGPVSGTWTKAESPYTVTGDISIAKRSTLTIEPGVVVKFAGHFGLTVGHRATLRATGTETEHIVFTPIDTDEGWFGIRFVNSETGDILKHCTIEYSKKPRTGGSSEIDLMGGGILCCGSWEAEPGYLLPSSPTIDQCLIANNHAEFGGGIMCAEDSEAVITNNTIIDNSADWGGAGIYMFYASGRIANNIIAHNSALTGGGVTNYMSDPSITNNTIVHNRPSALDLEIATWYPWAAESVPFLNNIVWQNEIYMSESVSDSDYDIRFNDIQGGWEGDGNIDADPCFADPENRDYHLQSEAGRWDPSSQSWVQDSVTSPCIDAGDPNSDWGAELWPQGKRVNMGAYGGTAQASMSLSTEGNAADLNKDDIVNGEDLRQLVEVWLKGDVLLAEDINRDGVVNLADFAALAESWLSKE